MGDDKQYVPRWLHQHVVVPASNKVRLPSASFANTDIWPWQLHWLSVTGTHLPGTGEPTINATGGVHLDLEYAYGISQEGPAVLVEAATDAIMNPFFRLPQIHDVVEVGHRFRFPGRCALPGDAGLVVDAHALGYLPQNPDRPVYYPGINVYGYHERPDGGREPAQLAGFGPTELEQGSSVTLDHADLFNDGEQEMILHEMIMSSGGRTPVTDAGADTAFWPFGNAVGFRINPSVGIKWMPRPEPIPVGNIAPWNRPELDFVSAGPRALLFPEETVIEQRQRLHIEVRNRAVTDREIDVCVFGLLEVE